MAGGETHGGSKFLDASSESSLEELGLATIRQHLGISQHPAAIRVVKASAYCLVFKSMCFVWPYFGTDRRSCSKAYDCIPQYHIGHAQTRARLREHLASKMPWLSVCGASFDGVGINDCILSARQAAETYVAEAFIAGHFKDVSSQSEPAKPLIYSKSEPLE
jgi:hypothetical protein